MTIWQELRQKYSRNKKKGIPKTEDKSETSTKTTIQGSAAGLLGSLRESMPKEEQALFDSLTLRPVLSALQAKSGEEKAQKTHRTAMNASHIEALAKALEKAHLGYGKEDLFSILQETTRPEIEETLRTHIDKFEPEFFEFLSSFVAELESDGRHQAALNLVFLCNKGKRIE